MYLNATAFNATLRATPVPDIAAVPAFVESWRLRKRSPHELDAGEAPRVASALPPGMFYHQIRQRGLFLKSLLEEAALCLLAAKCRTVRSRAILV